ncbi:unnamed protein product [Sphenostylis stenocarpa]|uniref:Homeobox-leucine zipper protein n=1 Tax=Sphenostylis stenocarpa TaxID=92480 RepID=A0AA86TFU7_9FABA|nr:unnamed protein product [Sphenostylis stenocarpa]
MSELMKCSHSSNAATRKKRSKNKKRFSDGQVKSLESMFATDSRLEPTKKLEVARELGLQPRQVAIWFQNKRARWKLKQIQQDYTVLRANYKTLDSQFDALNKEHQSLSIQLQKMKNRLQKPLEQTESFSKGHKTANSMESETGNGETIKREQEMKQPSFSTERSEDLVCGVISDCDSRKAKQYFGVEDDPSLLGLVENTDGSFTTYEDWGLLGSDDISGQLTSYDYQWLDFWS